MAITPAFATSNASDFTFPLLDGSAEIAMKIALDEDEGIKLMELGCFVKDGGPTIKLLQAILLGNIDVKVDQSLGPFPLRESLAMILQNEGREELFLQMTHLFSKINALLLSVRELEANAFCTVNSSSNNGHVIFSVSLDHGGIVVQIGFMFGKLLAEDWIATTIPNDVNVFIISSGRDFSFLVNQLRVKAQCMLEAGSNSSDPILLRRICDKVMEDFARAAMPTVNEMSN